MLATTVACPHCRTVLRPNQPVPAGMQVKCPRCAQRFVVGADSPPPVPPPVPPPAAIVPQAAVPAAPYVTRPQVGIAGAAPAAYPPPPPPDFSAGDPRVAPNQARVMALVLGGGLLFIGLAIGVTVILLSGGKPAEEKKELGDSQTPRANVPVNPNPQPVPNQPQLQLEEPVRPLLPPEDQKRVDAVADKAIAFLKNSQSADGSWAPPNNNNAYRIGYAALPALTLLECGVPPKDPQMQKAAAYIRQVAVALPTDNPRGTDMTYDLALAVLFLDRLGDATDKPLIQRLALRLVAGQTGTGGWSYVCPRLTDQEQQLLTSALLKQEHDPNAPLDIKAVDPGKLVVDGGPLPPKLKILGVWNDRINGPNARIPGDNSNTQFAILALLAAKKYDLPLHRSLALIVKRFREIQNPSGSWGYPGMRVESHVSPQPTMTCAGLLGLAVGLGLEKEAKSGKGKKVAEDPGIQKGLQLLAGHNLGVGNPTGRWTNVPLTNMYFLWSVERVGVIYNLKKIGDRDWYLWGAEMLVANQAADGSWPNGGFHGSHPAINTSFGLLFLRRANLAKDLTAKLQLGE